MKTIYIVPADSDINGLCRIVARETAGKVNSYHEEPGLWHEVGLMNSRGKLVCFDGTREERQALIDCEPLMAGLRLTLEETT